MTTPALEHDFAKPWAKQRVRTYTWCAAFTVTIALGSIIGVGVGLIPMVPLTGDHCLLPLHDASFRHVCDIVDRRSGRDANNLGESQRVSDALVLHRWRGK